MLFDGLVELLRLHGFPVTVEHELRLQRVLPHLDKGCKGPVELCDILCPLFATTQEQQEAFGPIFERWLRASGVAAIEPKAEAETPKPENAAQPWYNRRRTYLALIPVVVLGVALSVPQVRVRPLEEVPKPTITQSIQPIETPAGTLPQIVTTEIKYPPPPAWMPWWQARRQWIYGVIGTVLLLWTLFEIWRYQRRQVILQRSREERERPPHRLPLSLTPQQAGLGQDSTLAGAARWMRQREVTGSNAIDIPATIREAIKQAGFVPAFLERQRTREPAYLMLIDRQGFRDHQMALFDEYAAALKRRNVDVTVLHFEGDPRYPVEGSWDLMVQRHGGDRLLLATDGEQLRHPKTGLLWSWVARDFKNWAQRALLTPLEPERWGARERELGTVFAVWSAAPDSLLTLSRGLSGERVEQVEPTSYWKPPRQWRSVADDAVRALRHDLGDRAFRWLCACAHYPELHWDLTMLLGQMPDIAGTHQDCLRLFSLDWFRQGFIPRDWCERLVGELGEEESGRVRATIVKEIASVKIDEPKSDAGQYQRLWVEFQKLWEQRKTPQGWQGIKDWARGKGPDTLRRDAVVMRSLDTLRRSALDLILPEKWSRRVHESGVSLLGLRTVFRFAALALVGMVCMAAIFEVERRIGGFSPSAKQTEQKNVLDDVYFDSGSAALRSDAVSKLGMVAPALSGALGQDSALKIVVEGHTSEQGGDTAGSLALGDSRARAVYDYLVKLGVPADRLRSVSYGKGRPQCTEPTADCQKLEDRVHFAAVPTYLAVNVPVERVRTPTSAGEIQETYALIPHGTFQMGCSLGDNECYDDEKPTHQVTISRDFYMAQAEVTAGDFAKFVAHTKTRRADTGDPQKNPLEAVERVTWDEAKAFCEFVSGRLPTEAEWEYAARGGIATARYGPLDSVAWYDKNSGSQIHPVGQKAANRYGLFDMLGNAWEWTADYYGGYGASGVTDPTGVAKSDYRVLRGGSSYSLARFARASYRDYYPPGTFSLVGFRCVRPARVP